MAASEASAISEGEGDDQDGKKQKALGVLLGMKWVRVLAMAMAWY